MSADTGPGFKSGARVMLPKQADEAHAARARRGEHLLLQLRALGADLAKAAAENHGEANALPAALRDDIGHILGLQGDHCHIHGSVDIGDRGITLSSANLLVLGIDRINAALITVAFEREDGLAAGARQIRVRADNCNAARIEHPSEISGGHRLSLGEGAMSQGFDS
jgi:hypothetical protein